MITPFISVLSFVFLCFAPGSLFAQSDPINTDHKKAVKLAREGKSEESITLFKKLLSRKPGRQKILSDYLLVLSWAERCADAIEIYEGDIQNPLPFALNAAAKCYRNLKKFDQAILSYEAALLQQPKNRELHLGLAYAYADAGQAQEALKILNPLIDSNRDDLEPLFAKGYLHERRHQYLKALHEYEAILKKNPNNEKAWRLKIKTLSSLGAHQIALEMALKRGKPNDRHLETHLRLNRATQALRWGKTIEAVTPQERFQETDRGLAILSDILEKEPQNMRARTDQVIGWFDRFETERGIQAYEQLKREGIPDLDWLEMAAAEAYLALNRPAEAISIYREILKKRPNNFQARLNLFYGELIRNNFEEAEEIIRELKLEESSPTVRRQGVLDVNWRKVEVETAAIWLTAYQDQLARAEEGFRTLQNQAPMNSSLHSGLAHIYLWRGWPRKALKEFEKILHHDPRYVGVRVGYATTLMEMNQHEKAKIEVVNLMKRAPFNPHVKQLQKKWQLHNQNALWVYNDYRREERGARAWDAELSLNSRPFFSSYRMTADLIRQESHADNDQFTYSRFIAGLAYEGEQGLTFRQKISFDLESSSDTGTITEIAYQVDDYWRVDAKYGSFSLDVPLRASVIGITAKSLDLGLLYRIDERKELHFGTSRIRLSDGNRRDRYGLRAQYKLIPGTVYTHFLQLNLSGSRNSLTGRSYFNPRNDFAYSLTTIHEWRHKDTRPGKGFRQSLSGTIGGYDQAGFDTGFTGQVKYVHEWDFSVGETLAYHLAYNREIYDGKAEHLPAFNIRLIHHF